MEPEEEVKSTISLLGTFTPLRTVYIQYSKALTTWAILKSSRVQRSPAAWRLSTCQSQRRQTPNTRRKNDCAGFVK